MVNNKISLENRLKRHPLLHQRIEALIGIVEDSEGDLDKANAAEERVIQELQQMGKEALQGWAKEKELQKTKEYKKSNQQDKIKNKGKKKFIGIQHTEE